MLTTKEYVKGQQENEYLLRIFNYKLALTWINISSVTLFMWSEKPENKNLKMFLYQKWPWATGISLEKDTLTQFWKNPGKVKINE